MRCCQVLRGDLQTMNASSWWQTIYRVDRWRRPTAAARWAGVGGILGLVTIILSAVNAVSTQQAIALALPTTVITIGGVIRSSSRTRARPGDVASRKAAGWPICQLGPRSLLPATPSRPAEDARLSQHGFRRPRCKAAQLAIMPSRASAPLSSLSRGLSVPWGVCGVWLCRRFRAARGLRRRWPR